MASARSRQRCCGPLRFELSLDAAHSLVCIEAHELAGGACLNNPLVLRLVVRNNVLNSQNPRGWELYFDNVCFLSELEIAGEVLIICSPFKR